MHVHQHQVWSAWPPQFWSLQTAKFPFWTIDYMYTDKVLTARTIVASAPLNCPFNMPMHTINHLKHMLFMLYGI